jgi:hypothetical protein
LCVNGFSIIRARQIWTLMNSLIFVLRWISLKFSLPIISICSNFYLFQEHAFYLWLLPTRMAQQPWPTTTDWMSQRKGNERLGDYPYFRDWDSAWYFVLQVSNGYRIVVLTKPPTAPEVASVKLSISNPMAPTKPHPSSTGGNKTALTILWRGSSPSGSQEWLGSIVYHACCNASKTHDAFGNTVLGDESHKPQGSHFNPNSHQFKAQISQLCRSHSPMLQIHSCDRSHT